jgi:DNA-binding winged helix-turn-helix (wHTH) protein
MRFVFGDHELDDERFELRRGGAKVPLEPKTLDVLFHLVKNRDRLVSKSEILEAAWPGVTVSEASLSRSIMLARKAIGDDLQQALVTVRGRGFRFAAPVVEQADAPAAPPAVPWVDPTFVGRTACTLAFEARLDDAFAGRGSVVWITGEAGIGKTRTAEDLARRAIARKARVHVARAHEEGAARPFGLFSQVARMLAAGDASAAATRSLEGVAPLLDGELLGPALEATAFEAFGRFLTETSRGAPLVLVLDDLHRADEASLRLLRFLVREVRGGGLLFVGAFRDTAHAGDARARALGALLRENAGAAVQLRALTRDEVARFVEVATGVAPSVELSRDLLQRSGGNPLYLHQLLKSEPIERALNDAAIKVASSMELEQGIIESICLHLDDVSPGARDLLTLAAVLGREIETVKLAVVGDLGHDLLLDRLDEALRARLLVRSAPGGYRFAHAIVRDVLYKRLASTERAALHLRAGERLSDHFRESVDLHAAELARHFARALPNGDPIRAVELATTAARGDMARAEHGRAVKHWALAAYGLEHVRGERKRRVTVQLGLARASACAGDVTRAREAFLDAATLARTFGDEEALADAAIGFAEIVTAPEDELRRALLDEALAAISSASGDSAAQRRAQLEAASAARALPEALH